MGAAGYGGLAFPKRGPKRKEISFTKAKVRESVIQSQVETYLDFHQARWRV